MVIGRNRQTQQFLQQAMNRRCMEQIPAAHDMTYRLNSIVDHDGKMIAGRCSKAASISSRQANAAPSSMRRRRSVSLKCLSDPG